MNPSLVTLATYFSLTAQPFLASAGRPACITFAVSWRQMEPACSRPASWGTAFDGYDRSISLKRQPSAQPSPAQNSSEAAHGPLNQGQNATALHSKSFAGWPQATSQTHLLPVPARTLCSSQMDLLFCKQALQSAPTPMPLFTPFHLPGNVLPPQSPPPCVSL